MEYRGARGELIGTEGDPIPFGPWTIVVGRGGPIPSWHAMVTVDPVDALADRVGTTVVGRFYCDDRPTVIAGELRISPTAITTGDGRHMHELAGSGDLRWLEGPP